MSAARSPPISSRLGSPVTRADLEAYRAVKREPLVVKLSDMRVWSSPPPTQGLATLMILGIFDKLGVTHAESFGHVHGLIEAIKRAFLVRDKVVTDHDRLKHDPMAFLAPEALEREASRIDMRRALAWPQPATRGDTIWLGAADKSGLAVSYIQSIFWEFGSGRGAALDRHPHAESRLQLLARPGRDQPAGAGPAALPHPQSLHGGAEGRADRRLRRHGRRGPAADQCHGPHPLCDRFGVPLGEAIERPRWVLGRTWGSDVVSLRLEPRFDSALVDDLARVGHDVEVLNEPFSDTMGHAGAVVIHPRGGVEGAHDPRADGGAAGL